MTTPYLIFARKHCGFIRSCVLENYGYIRRELPFINALSIEVPDEKIGNIMAHRQVAMVARDGKVAKLPLFSENTSEKTPRSPEIFSGHALSSGASAAARAKKSAASEKLAFLENKGFGTTIAIIDTGVAPHYDLVRPYNRIIAFQDLINDRTLPYDDDGHGTHVAGIAAGNGYAAGSDPLFCGTAPMANIAAIKALDETGSGSASDILAAMQWIADHQEEYRIRVVNLSLGIVPDTESPLDPLALGTAALASRGITVVTAAGNSGPAPCTVTSPGISPFAVTVGSCTKGGEIAEFSSRGPTASGLHKPDLVAPGVDILSLDSSSCKGYFAQSGTSMSCPYAAGVIACMYTENPKLTPRQIQKLLPSMLTPLRGLSRDSQGRGALYV